MVDHHPHDTMKTRGLPKVVRETCIFGRFSLPSEPSRSDRRMFDILRYSTTLKNWYPGDQRSRLTAAHPVRQVGHLTNGSILILVVKKHTPEYRLEGVTVSTHKAVPSCIYLDRVAPRLERHLVVVEQPDLLVRLHVAVVQELLLQRGELGMDGVCESQKKKKKKARRKGGAFADEAPGFRRRYR